MYRVINDRVVNDAGEVAVSYYQTIPHVIGVSGYEYAFRVSANICMAWIKPDHVDKILGIRKACCGNSPKAVYRLEIESHVRRWINGGGR